MLSNESSSDSALSEHDLPVDSDSLISRDGSGSPLFEGGLLIVWGCGEFGQHGHGHLNDVFSNDTVEAPLWLGQDRKVTSVACGSSHTLAITGKGQYCNHEPPHVPPPTPSYAQNVRVLHQSEAKLLWRATHSCKHGG